MKIKKGQQSNKKKMPTDYNKLPTKILQKEFNLYIKPYLSKGKRGPKPKISFYKTFNYILYVLHTGIQWEQLKPYHNEIHWSNVYRHHNRWSKDGSYQNLFYHSIKKLRDHDKLDLSILHGDGSNTLAKKGAKKSVIPGINIRKAKKS
jgi:transposase